ncbi:hypothetical protein [Streptomyces sp. NPDC048565]|uniref:hypothetical protein n=1 Tax=Streptomyces sp. NPDC048565 TaxID=3155266 RepID=UPI00342C30FB
MLPPCPVQRLGGSFLGELLDLLGHLALVENKESAPDEPGGGIPAEAPTRLLGSTPDNLQLAQLFEVTAAQ